jgi:amino-acid N-acetyltransferase
VVRKAKSSDIELVRQLLQEASLNDQGIDEHVEHFFVVEQTGEDEIPQKIVGAIGMEVYPPYGLLRSFVLERSSWNAKLGIQLIQIILSYAEYLKLSEVYLLTTASQVFFRELGFEQAIDQEIPFEIKESPHISQSSLKSGILLVYHLFNKKSH